MFSGKKMKEHMESKLCGIFKIKTGNIKVTFTSMKQ